MNEAHACMWGAVPNFGPSIFLALADLLLKAVAADSEFPLAHSALSEAWWHLGYQTKARAEAQRARELSQDLPEEDRFLIEGQYWRAMGDSAKTVQAYRTLFQLFPDSLDYGLLLATAQIGFQPAAALQTLATLRRLPAPAGVDARIDMTEASAWIGQDLIKARAAAKSAIEKGLRPGTSRPRSPNLRISMRTGSWYWRLHG